jgi:hypothetical protein
MSETFHLETIDPSLFHIEDVLNDNACFYRAFANALHYSCLDINLEEIKILKNYGKLKPIDEVYENIEWGYDGEEQEALARYLQKMAYHWILENVSKNLEEYDMSIETMILLTHDIDIGEYTDRYKYFAGDKIIIKINTGKVYKSGRNKNKPVFYNEELEDRWGGTPEQIALSEHYNIPIIILTSQKYDTAKNKIVTGKIRKNKPERNVRFRLVQIIGERFLPTTQPIYILWKKTNKLGHYMSLYPKSTDTVIY